MSALGLIETMKVVNGRPIFKNLHISRLAAGLKSINVPINEYQLEDRILRLLKYECVDNGLKNFRLRIEVHKNRAHEYMPDIAALKWNCTLRPLESVKYTWNTDKFILTILPKHKKMIDAFKNLKHTDRAIYNEALQYARENDCNDALVLNENGTIADASIYNVFMVKDGIVYTPPLADAPVAGVLRELLLTRLDTITIQEKSITIQDLYAADELFLTNALRGIRAVDEFDGTTYKSTITKQVFTAFQQVVSEHFGEHLV